MKYFITGGAGFIGSCFVRRACARGDVRIINLDQLTYAGNLDSVPAEGDCHVFVRGDIGDRTLVRTLLQQYQPTAVVNFAAESHVDRSIDGPLTFVETNVLGTCRMLEEVRIWWAGLGLEHREAFRFLHVSTDEVYGSLGPDGLFTESTAYSPNSPYSASKAASDHFVRAYQHTYGLPVLITNCSNNYGPYQFPEKVIPLFITNLIQGKNVPLYGDGGNVRDWLHVNDHCRGIDLVVNGGQAGEIYNIGGGTELSNKELTFMLLAQFGFGEEKIDRVSDRPGHDRRYSVDWSKINQQLGYAPQESLGDSIGGLGDWYRSNPKWWQPLKTRSK